MRIRGDTEQPTGEFLAKTNWIVKDKLIQIYKIKFWDQEAEKGHTIQTLRTI